MGKIVKLEEFNWVSGRDAITIALCNTIIRKQNEIIDHLNSQAQPEERYAYTYKETPEGTIEHKIRLDPKPQDTPEEKEELTKEEWFMLKLAVNEIHNKGNGAYDEISRKIDRLSKLNKEEK